MSSAFIAIDWGTTNRRIYLIVQGKVVRSERDDMGALAMAGSGYHEAIATIRADYGDLPVLMAGMVGSSLGWSDAGYIGLPAAFPELASGLHWIDDRTAIVPGLCIDNRDRTDVMRGEEVQLLGAVAKGLVPRDAWLCQPGTHCKWAEVKDGKIASFVTAMSGELFALLRKSGVLAHHLTGPVRDNDAFVHGVAEGAGRDLAASLFSVRSLGVMGKLPDDDASSYASGILIGSDVACRLRKIGAAPVHILADEELGGLYRRAVMMLGGKATLIDSHAAFVEGITAIWDMSQ
ncbi:MAG: 2-dehydro-3-deoxygalactonokinase [Sphingomonadales bacterium]|nr:MAG: 2-dehydro-3-deoxygalactonokinase [Sphingomonadales bacterium]